MKTFAFTMLSVGVGFLVGCSILHFAAGEMISGVMTGTIAIIATILIYREKDRS